MYIEYPVHAFISNKTMLQICIVFVLDFRSQKVPFFMNLLWI